MSGQIDLDLLRRSLMLHNLSQVELERVAAARQSRYTFSDRFPAALSYYRLKMVDVDGSFQYSPVVSVSRDAAGIREEVLEAYPVPAVDQVTVRFGIAKEGPVSLLLTDAYGRVVARKVIEGSRGTNEYSFDLSGLPVATYQLTLRQADGARTIRVVKH